jgi:hypothetical protein
MASEGAGSAVSSAAATDAKDAGAAAASADSNPETMTSKDYYFDS